MRPLVDASRVQEFMRELGRTADSQAQVYLVGGSTAVLYGWRATTADLDLKFICDRDLGPDLSALKDRLNVNIELASPEQFIPELPGWRARSPFIATEGKVTFFHYDLYAQALAKIERGFERDVADVASMIDSGSVLPAKLLEVFETIEPELVRYPALDGPAFRRAVERVASGS